MSVNILASIRHLPGSFFIFVLHKIFLLKYSALFLQPVGLSPPVQMDQRNGLCRLLRASSDKRCARHLKRNRTWSDDLHASTISWKFQSQKLSWMGDFV
jgi:hypothetical protein